jgi:hypothetical protein
MVEISEVEAGSAAQRAGIKPHDILISINGFDIGDVLDYRFRITEKKVVLKIHRGPELFDVEIRKPEYDDIGLEFDTFLMDEKRSCRNKCVFCFIDQNPHGMRDTIYFKDDDRRLSFLQGNYITTTNLTEQDIQRITEMHCSPMNISVHATNPELRCRMMNNKNAGRVLGIMRRFAEANISMNAQIVLCKNLNDGEELDRSLRELSALYPQLVSVSVVPAGLTKHREGLYPLEQFTAEDCAAVIRQVDAFAEEFKKRCGIRLAYCSDEFYLKAGIRIPDEDYYDGYPQLENGVGMIASMSSEFYGELDYLDEYDRDGADEVSIATGEAAHGFISSIAEALSEKTGIKIHVYKIKNRFFGETVTVAGLLTGGDIAEQLDGLPLGKRLILPYVMLRAERDLFLDGMTPDQLSSRVGVPVVFSESDGADFIRSVLAG